ncbi:MAG: non-ribosomal peptide synthetase, partial [Elstera sp.]
LGFPLICDAAEGLTEAECRARLAADAAHPFDLTRAPLARGLLLTRGDESHWLLLTLHHAISDGWSMGVFARELADLYRAFADEQADPLPPLALQPADVTIWQQTHLTAEALAEDAAYWRARLAEVPPLLTLPTDAPRPAKQDFKGGLIRFEVPAETLTALKTLTHRTETSLFMALLTAWAAVLGRLSGQETLVIGAPTANRAQAELEGVIGFFVNTLALRFDLAEATSLLDLLRQTRATVLAAQKHQALPFDTIVEQVNPPRSLGHTPIFQTMLTWEDEGSASLPLPGLTVTPLTLPHYSAKFDVLLTLREEGGRLVGGLEFATALFETATAQRFERYFQRALRQLAESPETALASLDLLGARDRAQILTAWNPSPAAHAFVSVPDRLTARAAATPAAPALRFQGEDMSYGCLEAEANRLAHRLIAANLPLGAPVGLCLPRGFSMIVAVLAVLKAGGACLPLDPDYPAARLAVMIGEAQPPLILTETALAERLPPAVPRLCLDALPTAAMPERAPAVALAPEGLAYLLYTSGSTGIPKGVAQSHRLLSHLVDWQAAQTTPAPRRVLQFASLNFDVAFQEIVTTLCTGATLVLLPTETRRDLAALGPFIVAEGIERAFLPFAVLSQMAALGLERPNASGAACEVITAGEAVQVSDALRAFLRGLGGRYFYNQYGPTETHVATQHRLDLTEADAWPVHPPIGRPVDFAQVYLLTETLTPVPVGGVGEIYIGGAGVALGYYGQPALTAERFIANPFGPGHLYRSGDLGRYRADGGIEFLGRADQQVKWRGFRIETGDIEAALRALPGVMDAAVVLRDAGDGTRQLVAYLVGLADPARLRPALAARLPDYMLP